MSEITEKMGASNTIMGHPRGLFILFFTEMWERFSYYGMRGLLLFYLTQHFLFEEKSGYAIYGAYTALVYLTPVLGGLLADRYLGSRKAVTFGAILLVMGHAGMAIEGDQAKQYIDYQDQSYNIQFEKDGEKLYKFIEYKGEKLQLTFSKKGISLIVPQTSEQRLSKGGLDNVQHLIPAGAYETTTVRDNFFLQIFYFSLALVIVGVGFLKANISTIVGALYKDEDHRRDGGFNIFYMGINLGSFLAAITCGILGQTVGWWAGFGLAGVGMLAGLFVFLKGQKWLEGHAEPKRPEILKEKILLGLTREAVIYLAGFAAVFVVWQMVQRNEYVSILLNVFAVSTVLGIMIYAFWKCDKVERGRMIVVTILIMVSTVFWSLFEQAGSSLNVLADTSVDRVVFGLLIPASVFQFMNAFFIVLLAPLFTMMWNALNKKGLEPSIPFKFALGILGAGGGYFVMYYGYTLLDGQGKIALIWLVGLYMVHTMGELCLSPVGLSAVTKLSVKKVVGFMMGAWFLASAFSNMVASKIAEATGAETVGGERIDPVAALASTMDIYLVMGQVAVGMAVILMLFSPLLKKHMHGVK